MKVLLTGANGQLGQMIQIDRPQNVNLIALDKTKMDFMNQNLCYEKILEIKPDWVINCGAYTLVDEAEKNNKKALQINAFVMKSISEAIKLINGKLLHISTDFVFDGLQKKPYKPFQKKNPINIYGKSKALGENLIKETLNNGTQSIILRTSWLVGPRGNNFALKMLNLHKNNKILKVVSNQFGSPTTTSSLSKVCWAIIKEHNQSINQNNKFPGILHWSDAGVASWYDLAYEVGEIAVQLGLIQHPATVIPIKSSDYPTAAKRPFYSVLDCTSTQKIIGVNPLNWRDSLFDSLKILKK